MVWVPSGLQPVTMGNKEGGATEATPEVCQTHRNYPWEGQTAHLQTGSSFPKLPPACYLKYADFISYFATVAPEGKDDFCKQQVCAAERCHEDGV